MPGIDCTFSLDEVERCRKVLSVPSIDVAVMSAVLSGHRRHCEVPSRPGLERQGARRSARERVHTEGEVPFELDRPRRDGHDRSGAAPCRPPRVRGSHRGGGVRAASRSPAADVRSSGGRSPTLSLLRVGALETYAVSGRRAYSRCSAVLVTSSWPGGTASDHPEARSTRRGGENAEPEWVARGIGPAGSGSRSGTPMARASREPTPMYPPQRSIRALRDDAWGPRSACCGVVGTLAGGRVARAGEHDGAAATPERRHSELRLEVGDADADTLVISVDAGARRPTSSGRSSRACTDAPCV